MARPREWDRAALREAFFAYIESHEIPVVAQFAYEHGISRDQVYDMAELSDALKACIAKKEAMLELKALSGDVNPSMAIFSLKQLGWTDKQDTTLRGDKKAPLQFSSTDAEL